MEAVGQALIDAETLAALGAVGCVYPRLFAPLLTEALRFDADSVSVYPVDERGARRHGVTVAALANQVRADYHARAPGKYFK